MEPNIKGYIHIGLTADIFKCTFLKGGVSGKDLGFDSEISRLFFLKRAKAGKTAILLMVIIQCNVNKYRSYTLKNTSINVFSVPNGENSQYVNHACKKS